MDKWKKKENLITLMVGVIIVLIYLYRINVMGTPYFSDELGYWAAGAWVSGIDWSPVFSHSPYYGWGYGIILAPLFLISNSTLRFQVAEMLNIVMVLGSYALLVSINKRFFPNTNKFIISIVSGTTMLFSYNIVYAHLTMCESFLVFLFLLSVRSVVDICEKNTVKSYLFLSVILGIQLAVHLRTIVFVFAGIFTVGYLVYRKRISLSNIIAIGVFAFLVIMIVFAIKNRLVLAQYTVADSDMARETVNDSFSQHFSRIKHFVTLEGWKRLFISVMGKWFYFGCASFFLIWIGMRYFIRVIIMSVKKNAEFDEKSVISLYIAISFICAFLLSAETTMWWTRFDHVFYGRYTENVVPVIISVGLLSVINEGLNAKKISLYMLCTVGMSIILYYVIKKYSFIGVLPMESSGFAGIMIRGNQEYGMQFTIFAAHITILLMILVYIVFRKNNVLGCAVLAVVWSVIAYRGLELCAYPELKRQDLIIEAAHELDESDEKIYALLPDDIWQDITIFVDILWLQYHLGERTVYTVAENDIGNMGENELVAISRSYPDSGNIASQYTTVWENNKIFIVKVQ